MNLTIRQIKAFLAVADAGSFTRAADRLKVPQPTLSLWVRDLERELAVRLIDRTTRRLELTQAGRDFRSRAQKIISNLEELVKSSHELADGKRGKLVIAAPPLLAATICPDAIGDFQAAFPGVRVELIDTRTDLIVAKVRNGEADCGIGTFPPNTAGTQNTPLSKDLLALFCSSHHPLAQRRKVAWPDLDGLPLVTLTRDSGIRLLAELGFQAAGFQPRISFEVTQITTAVALTERNLGVAVLPAYAWHIARFRDVAWAPLTSPVISREISIIRSDARSPAPSCEHFVRFIRRVIRKAVPRLDGKRALRPAARRHPGKVPTSSRVALSFRAAGPGPTHFAAT